MKSWLDFLAEKSEPSFLEEEGYTLFFKKKGKYYAAKEDGRITFAKIRTKDIKDISKDKEDITFIAKDLSSGKEKKFREKDIKEIEVCDKEEAELNSKQLYKNIEEPTNMEENSMCKCKCLPCLRGKCNKCRCKDCRCEGCSCSK